MYKGQLDKERAAWEAERERFQAEIATANVAVSAAQAATSTVPIDPALMGLGPAHILIPKPKGSAGNGYSLQKEMGLGNNKPFYNRIMVCGSISHVHVAYTKCP